MEQGDYREKGIKDECKEALHKIYHYLDGVLTEEKRQEIKLHLEKCRPCQGAYDFEQELKKLVANHTREPVPEGLKDKIARAINHEIKNNP